MESKLININSDKDCKIKNANKTSSISIAIVYHYPCYDGAYAALNAYLYYHNFNDKNHHLKFIPSNSHNRISEVEIEKYDKVYILDKGLNEEDYLYIFNTLSTNIKEENNTRNTKVILIDHHNSSIDLYNKSFKEKYFDLGEKRMKLVLDSTGERAASGLTYDYFRTKAVKKVKEDAVNKIFSQDYKSLNEYIEDSDVGLFVRKYSHEFKSGLSQYLTPLKQISDFSLNKKFLSTFYEVNVSICIRSGEKAYKKYKRNAKNEIAGRNCYIVELRNENKESLESWKFLACFTNNKQYRNYACPILSQISLAKGLNPIGAFIYYCDKNVYKMSLRSHTKDIDLGYICSLFGGGGHKSAAAFSNTRQFFDDIVLSNVDLYKILNYY